MNPENLTRSIYIAYEINNKPNDGFAIITLKLKFQKTVYLILKFDKYSKMVWIY